MSGSKPAQMFDEVKLRPGELFDERFLVERFVGAGGMSSVYTARDTMLERQVAIKLLSRDLVRDPVAIQRFRNEARLSSSLEHVNIVRTLSFGVSPAREPYLVMELVEGESLSSLLEREGTVSRERFEVIFLPLVDAMVYAHGRNIVHRDLKPGNIMLTMVAGKETPKILDFGIAKIVNLEEESVSAAATTMTTSPVGSPQYMSPEQCMGGKVDERSDIYSLACVMYESLTGKTPFSGSTPLETMYEHLHASVPDFDDITGPVRIPRNVGLAIVKAMAKRPEDRPQSMVDFRAELRGGLVSGSGETILGMSGLKRRRRMPARIVPLLAVSALLSLVVVIVSVQFVKLKGDPFEKGKTLAGQSGAEPRRDAVGPISYFSSAQALKSESWRKPPGSAKDADLKGVIALYEEGIEVARKTKFEEPQVLWRAYRELAFTHSDLKDYPAARKCHQKAYHCFPGTGDYGKDQRLLSRMDISSTYFAEFKGADAAAEARSAINEYEGQGVENNPELGCAYSVLAKYTADPGEAYKIRLKALEIFKSIPLPYYHINAVGDSVSAANYEIATGRKESGFSRMVALEKALERHEHRLSYGQYMYDIGEFYKMHHNVPEARRLYQRGLEAMGSRSGRDEQTVKRRLVEGLKSLPQS